MGEGRCLQRLGEHVGRVGSGRNVLHKNVAVLDGITNKVEFYPYMTSSEGCHGRSCDAEACLIIFTNDGRLVDRYTKLIE